MVIHATKAGRFVRLDYQDNAGGLALTDKWEFDGKQHPCRRLTPTDIYIEPIPGTCVAKLSQQIREYMYAKD